MRTLVSTLVGVALAATLLSGCYRHRWVNTQVPPEPVATEWTWNHHLLWGIIKLSPDVHLDEVCPAGVARIENWVGPLQVLLNVITGGIYSPTTIRVFCAQPHMVVPVEVEVPIVDETVSELRKAYPDLEEQLREVLGVRGEPSPAVASGPAGPAAL